TRRTLTSPPHVPCPSPLTTRHRPPPVSTTTIAHLRLTYATTPSKPRPWPPSSDTNRIAAPQAAVVTNAARTNGAACHAFSRNPPPTRAAPSAIPRSTCWIPCPRP